MRFALLGVGAAALYAALVAVGAPWLGRRLRQSRQETTVVEHEVRVCADCGELMTQDSDGRWVCLKALASLTEMGEWPR